MNIYMPDATLEILIRHSNATDFEALRQVYLDQDVFAGTMQLPFPSPDIWKKRLNEPSPNGYNLIAEINGEVVGHLIFETLANPRRKHVGKFGVGVKKEWQGVGSKLLVSAIDMADNWLNVQRIEITVFTDNLAAIALYRKFGFEVEGEGKGYAFRDGRYVNVYFMARIRNQHL